MIIRISFILAVFFSVISQIPSVLHSSWGDFMKYSWIIPAGLLLFKDGKQYFDRPIRWFILFVFCFGFYCVLFEAFTLDQYVGRDYYNIIISFLIYSVSYKYWKSYGSEKRLEHLSFILLLSGCLLAYYLYADCLKEGNLMSRVFAYNRGKNSASVILLCAILIPMLNLRFKNKWISIIEYALFAFMFYVIVLLRSRATFIGVFYIIYYFIFRIRNRKLTVSVLLLTAFAVIWVLTHSGLYHTVVDGILLAGRDAEDLNELSSGRVYFMAETWDLFIQNMWFGNGNMYMDCMPLVVLAQYGIVGASMVFGFLLFMGEKIYKFNRNNFFFLTSFLLFNVLMLNSLFEAQPPFGPGIKCFMLWMMLGFSFASPSSQQTSIE